MKKTLLIIVAALSTSLAFGQTAAIKGKTSPAKASTSSVETISISDVSAKTFQTANLSSKQSNTKGAGDRIVKWKFTPTFFDSLKFGHGDSSGYTRANWKYGNFAWVNSFTSSDMKDAKTRDSLGATVTVDKSKTYNWFTDFYHEDIKAIADSNGGGCLIMSTADNGPSLGDPLVNTWVQFPSFHVGDRPAIVEFINHFFRYGNENYLITYSINNGTSWDTIVFNYLSPSMDIITQHYTITSVGLPEKCQNKDVIIRLNLIGRQSIWIIPFITVSEAKDYDLHINYYQYANNAYHNIPLGLKTAPFNWSASISNYGNEKICDVKGLITIADKSGKTMIDTSISTKIDTLTSVKDTVLYIAPGHVVAGFGYDSTDIKYATIPVDKEATYSVTQSITYKAGEADSVYSFARNPIYVNVNYDQDSNWAIWSRDNGIAARDYYWHVGYQSNGTTLDPEYNVGITEYKLLVEYNTHEDYDDTEEPLYIIGVQAVLDPGTSRRGPFVRSCIHILDSTTAVPGDSTRVNFNFTVIEGRSFQVSADAIADLSSSTSLYYDGEYEVLNMPLEEDAAAIQLEKGKTYYAGYELEDDLPFYVSRNMSQYIRPADPVPFRTGTGAERGTVMFFSPGARSLGFYPYATDVPMLRLIVSKDPDRRPATRPWVGINTPKEVNFNLNAYPNPASEHINIAYTIENSTKVTIEIYDIFGRLVKIQESKAVAGERKIEQVNVSDLVSGTYIYTLNVDGVKQSKKFIVTK